MNSRLCVASELKCVHQRLVPHDDGFDDIGVYADVGAACLRNEEGGCGGPRHGLRWMEKNDWRLSEGAEVEDEVTRFDVHRASVGIGN